MKIRKFILPFVVAIFWQGQLNAQTAQQIVDKMDEVANEATDQKTELKIILIDKNGKESTRTATLKSKGDDRMLFRFTSPESQAGISILSLPNGVMYLYLPAYAKERRINASSKGQKFAGTDFCYEDMEVSTIGDKYDAKILSENAETWTLEMNPKPEEKTIYSKLNIIVNKSNYYPQSIEFFHKKTGLKSKKLSNTKIEKIDGHWVATEMEMVDLKSNHKTKMEIESIKFNNGFANDEFSLRELKK
ncbi:MAG: outer membrane lipoprotein-sorting protein [Chlorobi bacterium]|nr:outer membrane lipoprotein-sorting protein [Chlorobiota bacterium]